MGSRDRHESTSPWIVGIGTSLVATIIVAAVAMVIPSGPDAATVWRHYWPEAAGLVAGALWFGGYWFWQQWKRQQRRLTELEQQASDNHVETVVYKVLDANTVFQRLNAVDQRVSRLEEWKLQGGGDTAEALAHRAIQSEIDPKRGGMDVKP